MSDASVPRSLGLVVESPADGQAAQVLVDRVLCAHADWVDDSLLEHLRRFRGIEPGSPVISWKKIPALARAHGVRSHGH